MVIFSDKHYVQQSLKPNEDFTDGAALYVVDDTSALARKIKEYAPYYDFVLTKTGKIKDITPFDPPVIENIPIITTDDLALAIAEVAEQQATDKIEVDLALAELAEMIVGGV